MAKPCATPKALAHGSGRDVNARQHRPGMAVQDAARTTASSAAPIAIEITELRVDRGERRHCMALAEDEQVLAAPRRVLDIDIDEPAVVQRHQRDRRRKCAARVQPFVDGVAALLRA